ncbi:MAG: alcohol dehydrogenase catalytic domain-containing protein [Microthrixaceae bacterium]
MKAVRIVDGAATLVDAPAPTGEGVLVDVVSASICGSDLHLIDGGLAEGRILGHEVAGRTPDGTAVVVEPIGRCGHCRNCLGGLGNHCDSLVAYGIFADGGMAEQLLVPAECIHPLPSGVDVATASVVEPLAVAVHGLHRARAASGDRVAIVGAGPVGLALAAACRAEGIGVEVEARHDHQRAAVERLGGAVGLSDNYDVVFDAVGTSGSLAASIGACRPEGRVGLVGSLWEPATIDVGLCISEVEIIPSMMYCNRGGESDFRWAAQMLAAEPSIAATMLTHRFPLDGAEDAFEAARDRSGGTIKAAFDVTA